ncbi:hypothetical protein H072_7985 [Dactylellina haptotyla CBS 200.50]|uniref:ATP-dependent RNA helicase n=1 Tax=Dactylellina haptotyla (strain CBS 200.50) TaxID=1284197 RepID=S8AB01_DACHA|nr:hypothetical protein H072_7985 [Dactylellina haptotyla CBS 200.50]
MRSASALVRRSRQSNGVSRPSQLLLPSQTLSPSGSVLHDICYSCLAKLRFAQGRPHGSHVPVAGYAAAFHSSAISYAGMRTKPKSVKNFRKAVEGNRALKELVQKPSRMVLSAKVGRGISAVRDKKTRLEDRRPEPAIDTGGGMNRRVFKLRSDDKQQYSRDLERRRREQKETASRPSPSPFEQRPAAGPRAERSFAGKLPQDRPKSDRRAAAAAPEANNYAGAGRRLASRQADADSDKKYTRPPVRRFAQMKHIASLDHVSSKTREVTHAAEERFGFFETFDLLPQTLEALQKDALDGLENMTPTPVQSLVIPQLLDKNPAPPLRPLPSHLLKPKRGQSPAVDNSQEGSRHSFETYLIAAETGSGKTLSYVLPLMDTLKRREVHQKEQEALKEQQMAEVLQSKRWMFDIDSPPVTQDTSIGKPFAVILVPTSELVFQVGTLLKKLSYIIKMRTEMVSKDFTGKVIRERLFGRKTPDIIVGTPFMIDRITEANPQMLHRTSHIIVDEADSLFDRSFSPLTGAIIPRAVNLEKLILCSATIPKSLDTYIRRKYPECHRLVTANLHAIPRRVQLQVIEAERDPYRGNKPLACAHILGNIAKDSTEPGYKKRVVVFVNERETTAEVTAYLQEKGFDAVEINRDSDSRSILESFTGEKEAAEETEEERRGAMKVLVTTDLASRGVDTKTVKNVILYDVPYTSIDFIHRLGRTGRMGRRGRAWVLVDKDSNQEYVKEVRKTMFLGQALI